VSATVLPTRQWRSPALVTTAFSICHSHLINAGVSPTETKVTAGGKPAIRRGPLVKALTVHAVDGKTVSSSEGMVPDNTVYVPLNETDVLTISSPSGAALSVICGGVLSTLTFKRECSGCTFFNMARFFLLSEN
jgi:hypothetical protein